MNIDIRAMQILHRLEDAGFSGYLVGGCVRDMLMGRAVHDYDITTDALPEQICGIFSDLKVIPTGMKHGTVTVLMEGEPFEITTFRVDGDYSDSRRPDSVHFTRSLKEDLARRDFTMNAIAMDSSGALHDPFSGRSDIENRIIRCVGDPEKRFTEDALRILRAVRFASVLGFDIEENTGSAALLLRERLDLISAERISAELTKLICGENLVDVMLRYRDIFGQIIPELVPCFDFDQHSRYHKYDVYEHIVRAVDNAPENNVILRTAMLLHDVGKPPMFKLDDNGVGHFKGHAQRSAEMAHVILRRLRFPTDTIRTVCTVIAHHSDEVDSEMDVKRKIADLGFDTYLLLMEAKKSDNMAKQRFVLSENDIFNECIAAAYRLRDEGCCLSLKQLAVNGSDMAELGLQGAQIGDMLEKLFNLVIGDVLENDRDRLMAFVKEELR